MISVSIVTWVGEPNNKKDKNGYYPKYTMWPFQTFYSDTMVHLMNEDEHNQYAACKAILDFGPIKKLSPKDKKKLLALLEKFGEFSEEIGRMREFENHIGEER